MLRTSPIVVFLTSISDRRFLAATFSSVSNEALVSLLSPSRLKLVGLKGGWRDCAPHANRQRLLSFLSLRTIVNENLTYSCHSQFTTYVNVAAYISN